MPRLTQLLVLGLPLLLIVLLVGLGLGFAALAREGRGRIRSITRAAGWINLALCAPLVYLAVSAETVDVQRMFGFCSLAFLVVGLMDLRFVARFDDDGDDGDDDDGSD